MKGDIKAKPRSRQRWLILISFSCMNYPISIFFACALFFAVGMDREIGPYDEGLILTGAMRVMAGEVPHRDFYANYGPAQFEIMGSLFRVFGQSVLVERAYDLMIRSLIVAITYQLLARYCRRWIALSFSALCALWMFSLENYGYPIFPIILLSLIGSALVVSVLRGASSKWRMFAAGAAAGLTALFRYDLGFFVLVAHMGAICGWLLLQSRDRQKQIRLGADMFLHYILGTSLVFLPVAISYLAVASLAPFVHDIFTYPVHYYSRMRALPFPGIAVCLQTADASVVYLPVVICCVVSYILTARKPWFAKTDGKNSFLCVLGLLAAICFLKGVVRVSPIHMVLSFIPALMILAVLIEIAFQQKKIARKMPVAIISCWAVVATFSAVRREIRTLRVNHSSVLHIIVGRHWQPEAVPRTAPFRLGHDRADAVRFIMQVTKPDEYIFVGLNRTDKIFVNDNIIYFAAGRLPATHWHHFDPGLQTRADIQVAMVAELEAKAVSCVVLTSEWDNVNEPNESAKSSGVHILNDYIYEHYRNIKSFGKISVLLRKADGCSRGGDGMGLEAANLVGVYPESDCHTR
jgi:hypothetical protein